jgi:hypothetical protein
MAKSKNKNIEIPVHEKSESPKKEFKESKGEKDKGRDKTKMPGDKKGGGERTKMPGDSKGKVTSIGKGRNKSKGYV